MAEKSCKNEHTRNRLLMAAGEVFARKGYRSATVREIAMVAGANVAAVNYHFGDKEALYLSVLRYSHQKAMEKFPAEGNISAKGSPEERLKSFIHSFLHKILDEDRPAWHGRLMLREIVDPTAALGHLVEESIRPLYGMLASHLGELLGLEPDDATVRMCSISIIGQCVYLSHSRRILEELFGQKYDADSIDRMAAHISRFSLMALKGTGCAMGEHGAGASAGCIDSVLANCTERLRSNARARPDLHPDDCSS